MARHFADQVVGRLVMPVVPIELNRGRDVSVNCSSIHGGWSPVTSIHRRSILWVDDVLAHHADRLT